MILIIRVILPGLPRSSWTEIPGKAWLTPAYDPPIRNPRPYVKENYRESYTPHKVKTYWTFFLFKKKIPQCSRQLSGAKCLHENVAKFPRKQLVVIIFRIRCISYFLEVFNSLRVTVFRSGSEITRAHASLLSLARRNKTRAILTKNDLVL